MSGPLIRSTGDIPANPLVVEFVGPTVNEFTGQAVPAGNTTRHVFTGATLRDYFVAHAPFPPAKWFHPTMARECPAVPSLRRLQKVDAELASEVESYNLTAKCSSPDALHRVHGWLAERAEAVVAQQAWQAEFRAETWLQWPGFYADQMLRRRG